MTVAVASDASDEQWVEHSLTPPAPSPSTFLFGAAVAIAPDGQTVFVTSPLETRVYAFSPGAAGDWSGAPQIYDAPPPPSRVGIVGDPGIRYARSFGESLATDGASLVVGVPNAYVDTMPSVGMAWVLDLASGTWRALLPDPAAGLDSTILGQSVAVSGDLIAAGIPEGRSKAGFLRIGGVALWSGGSEFPRIVTQPALADNECIPDNSSPGPAFGLSIAFLGRTLFVGSSWEVRYDPGSSCTDEAVAAGEASQGAVYRFDDTLTQVGPKLLPGKGLISFGRTIGVDGNTLMAFVEGPEDDATGSVAVYAVDGLSQAPGGGAEIVRPRQSLVASGYTGTNFGSFEYGTGISISGQRALLGSGLTNSYLFSQVDPPAPAATLTLADSRHTYGQSGALVATFDPPASPDASGPVEFFVGEQAVGSAPVIGGGATLTLQPAAVPAAPHVPIRATAPTAHGSLTAEAALTVDPATTTTRVLAATPLSDRSGWQLRGYVASQYGTVPSGKVEIGGGSPALALAAGTFSAILPASAGVPGGAATARYLGDGNHLASESSIALPTLTPKPGQTKPPKPDAGGPGGGKDSALGRTGAANGPLAMGTVAALLVAAGGAAYAIARRRSGPGGK